MGDKPPHLVDLREKRGLLLPQLHRVVSVVWGKEALLKRGILGWPLLADTKKDHGSFLLGRQ